MIDSGFVFFIVAFGFVTGALVNYLGGFLNEDGGSFRISFDTAPQILAGLFICMFAGPYLTIEKGVSFWRDGRLSNSIFCVAALISLLWSFCCGIFVVQMLWVLGLISN